MSNENTLKVSAVLFQDGQWWSAQCLEYDVAAQAQTLSDLQTEFQRVLISHLAIARELGRKPFEGIPPAPRKFWDLFKQSRLRVESDELPFRNPEPLGFPAVLPRLKIAEQHAA